jgi:SARP family transcriptional regulator, regulator of embCAB operon
LARRPAHRRRTVAYHVASRPLPRDHERPWLDEWRRRLDDVRVRGLAPFRETGYVILMEALERSGNVAEALRVYDELRVILRDELAIAPSLAVQTVYRRLLGEAATETV